MKKKNKCVIYFLQNPCFLCNFVVPTQQCSCEIGHVGAVHGSKAPWASMMSTHSRLKVSSLRDDTVTFILVFHKHEVGAYKCLPLEQDVNTCTEGYKLKESKLVLFCYGIHLSMHEYNDRHPSLCHSHSLSSCPLYLCTLCSTILPRVFTYIIQHARSEPRMS